jgi:hypothetical protein
MAKINKKLKQMSKTKGKKEKAGAPSAARRSVSLLVARVPPSSFPFDLGSGLGVEGGAAAAWLGQAACEN